MARAEMIATIHAAARAAGRDHALNVQEAS